jgi:pimeloyl-ACP methyl ester carboxylesterase
MIRFIPITILLFVLFSCGTKSVFAQNSKFGRFEMTEFEFEGHEAKIVFPEKANESKNWIWRARFWGHEPQADLALLEKGFHLVYVEVGGLFGNNEAVNIWNNFYSHLIENYKLNSKVVLEGMSRGGLIIYNWAAANTDKVACIYADAPVCDIKSWPGGLYAGKGSKTDWKKCLDVYDLNKKSALEFKGIPIYTEEKVAQAGIPVLHVCGAADKVVPFEENTKLLADNFRKAGGEIEIILKEGIGHHPHSLKDPKIIVDFILRNSVKK